MKTSFASVNATYLICFLKQKLFFALARWIPKTVKIWSIFNQTFQPALRFVLSLSNTDAVKYSWQATQSSWRDLHLGFFHVSHDDYVPRLLFPNQISVHIAAKPQKQSRFHQWDYDCVTASPPCWEMKPSSLRHQLIDDKRGKRR